MAGAIFWLQGAVRKKKSGPYSPGLLRDMNSIERKADMYRKTNVTYLFFTTSDRKTILCRRNVLEVTENAVMGAHKV